MSQIVNIFASAAKIMNSFSAASLVVGDPETVAAKILHWQEILDIERFMLHTSAGNIPHEVTMRSIELLGTKVSQIVRGR